MTDAPKCPECGTTLREDPAHSKGRDKLNRMIRAWVCDECGGLFGRQDDGLAIVRLLPPR
jgi:hypothetical protein